MTGDELRRLMRGWPTGLAVVTASVEGGPVGCTVNAFVSVSLRPPLLLIALSELSRTLGAISELGRFGVNVLAGQQRDLAASFAGPASDRFSGVSYGWEHGVPLLTGAVAVAVCEVDRVIVVADHALVFGRPVWCARDRAASPLVFADGGYYVLSAEALSSEALSSEGLSAAALSAAEAP